MWELYTNYADFYGLRGFIRIMWTQCGMRDCFDECLFGNKLSAKQSQNRKMSYEV
jgi:hypothetical protein